MVCEWMDTEVHVIKTFAGFDRTEWSYHGSKYGACRWYRCDLEGKWGDAGCSKRERRVLLRETNGATIAAEPHALPQAGRQSAVA